jgi:hypothetical protein
VLISPRLREPIVAGEITLLFRRWKRTQATAGHRYRTGAGMIEVDAVDVIDEDAITAADARAAGYDDPDAVRRDLRGEPGTPLHRLRIHPVHDPDPRTVLAASADLTDDDVAALDRRLDRLDRASSHGPWTAATLDLIATRPAVRAADLAAAIGRETQPFKLDVRKLKAMGLTISLDVGYRLSPRGEAYRRLTNRRRSA